MRVRPGTICIRIVLPATRPCAIIAEHAMQTDNVCALASFKGHTALHVRSAIMARHVCVRVQFVLL